MKTYTIASIPGDGIGKEVVPAALDVIATLGDDFKIEIDTFPWGCDYYLEHNSMMPEDGLRQLKHYDAIFLGAVGDPARVPDHISLWGLLIKIRRGFHQQINMRPARYFEGLHSPLIAPKDFDFVVVRENSEGEYSEVGGRMYDGEDEIAIQNNLFSKRATKAAMRYAFSLASERRSHLMSATKSNGMVYSMPFWDEVFQEMSDQYPSISTDSQHIDALAASFITRPESFDVLVASNLFGDILTDVGAALMGSIGIAPAANINIDGRYPSMFEPVHGSAPDIAGKGIANPIGQIWTAKLMLDHLGETTAAARILSAIEFVIKESIVTGDLGGKASTKEVTEAIKQHITDHR
ncbi:tartrate dehydrogenase [Shouchella shacheensis]|uniref:tartrate dehydrogenase n=1 Tax=Shouchella shacheensis TaxID=1649580 RepID=UPI00073FE7C0|nr:tartrate dehydrogenase [Shouchella shacheensis]